MPDLSPFQTLPLHIAEVIGYYCIGRQRDRYRDDFCLEESLEDTWLVLQDVSRSWMHLAHKKLYESVTLRLSKNPDHDEFATTLLLHDVIEQSTAIIPHVQIVDIHFDSIIENPDKEDFEKLSRVWPEDLVFPKVRSLNCHLEPNYTNASDSARTVRYFKWFIERVHSSFPNLRETTIEFGANEKISISISPSVLFSEEWDPGLFLSALFRIGIYNQTSVNDEIMLMDNAPELTSFSCLDCPDYRFASWITKRSANTLEKLHYGEEGSDGFKDFMLDDDGLVVVYPRLRDLRVNNSSDDKGELTTDKSIVPFPALQRLSMYSSCVFKDDTLFRGLNDTLISLDIGLHRGFVDIFRKYKVLSQGVCQNILHISVTHDNRHGLPLPADKFAQEAFGLASSGTQSMTIDSDTLYRRIISAVSTCPYLENIQILNIWTKALSLLEILDILKHFPFVTEFGCHFRGVDLKLSTIQDKLIPSHLGTQYSHLNSPLKCWRVYSLASAPEEELAVLLVTLAVLCPNFSFVNQLIIKREACSSAIGHILSSGLYDQHAKRLGHLFEP